jgi:hypothetical protein
MKAITLAVHTSVWTRQDTTLSAAGADCARAQRHKIATWLASRQAAARMPVASDADGHARLGLRSLVYLTIMRRGGGGYRDHLEAISSASLQGREAGCCPVRIDSEVRRRPGLHPGQGSMQPSTCKRARQ